MEKEKKMMYGLKKTKYMIRQEKTGKKDRKDRRM